MRKQAEPKMETCPKCDGAGQTKGLKQVELTVEDKVKFLELEKPSSSYWKKRLLVLVTLFLVGVFGIFWSISYSDENSKTFIDGMTLLLLIITNFFIFFAIFHENPHVKKQYEIVKLYGVSENDWELVE